MRQTVTFGRRNAPSVPARDDRQRQLRPVHIVAIGIGAAIVMVAGAAVLLAPIRQPQTVGNVTQSAEALAFVVEGVEACLPEAARPFWKGTTVPPVASQLFLTHVEAIARGSGTAELERYVHDVIGPILKSWDEPDRQLFMGLMENGLVSEETRSCVVSGAMAKPPV